MRIDALTTLLVLLAAGCAASPRIDSGFASRAFYAPGRGRIQLALGSRGEIEEAAMPIDPDLFPAAARTAIERERPGGEVVGAWRVERRGGVTFRLARIVVGESVEHEATEAGEILRRTVVVPGDGPAFATARAASERVDPGGSIESVRYSTGPGGNEILVTKTIGGARQVLSLRAAGDGYEMLEIRRIVEAEIAVAGGGSEK